MRGAVAAADAPAWRSSTGTSRQATTLLPFRLDRLGEEPLERRGARCVAGQEAHRDAVAAEGRQRGADLGAKQGVRQLQRHARAVAGAGVGALGAAVLEVGERRQRAHDRLVTRDAVEPRDERDAAGVVLVRRVVEADRLHACHPVASSRLSVALDRWGERSELPASAVSGAKRGRP